MTGKTNPFAAGCGCLGIIVVVLLIIGGIASCAGGGGKQTSDADTSSQSSAQNEAPSRAPIPGGWNRKGLADVNAASNAVGGFSDDDRKAYANGLAHIANAHQRPGSYTIRQIVDDESVTGQRISGNPYKFNGTNVDLHGTVASVIDETHFNLSTGSISADDEGNISNTVGIVVIECQSTADLEKNQSLRVLGTIIEPLEGTNMMGGSGKFAQVHAEYME